MKNPLSIASALVAPLEIYQPVLRLASFGEEDMQGFQV
jgi:hypothetical protein